MLLNRGALEGKRYLTEASFKVLTSVHTGDLETGFFRETFGRNYGWGIGTCILRTPHEGVAAMLKQPVTVRARCHHCDERIELAVTPEGPAADSGLMAWVGERGDLRGKACTAL